jgi:hypothetical protein
MARLTSVITGQDRTYDEKVDKALVLNFLKQVPPSRPPSTTSPSTSALGIQPGMERSRAEGRAGQAYAGSKLARQGRAHRWLKKSPADFKASDDSLHQGRRRHVRCRT